MSEQPTVVKVTFNAEDFFDALHKANKQLYEMALDAVSTNFAQTHEMMPGNPNWESDENGNKILNLSEVPEDLRE